MRNERGGGGRAATVVEQPHTSLHQRQKLGALLHSDPAVYSNHNEEDYNNSNNSYNNNNNYYYNNSHTRQSSASNTSPSSRYFYPSSNTPTSGEGSPYSMSPWNGSYQASPYTKSPWITAAAITSTTSSPFNNDEDEDDDNNSYKETGLIGSIVREEGHIYSLAASGDFLYTGSDSKNIRIWKNLKEFSGLKSSSGLVKAIVISGDRIFTGHQDGKIRVWKISPKNPSFHKRIGSLPTLRDFIKCSVNPKGYVEVRRHKNVVKVKHFDAVSSLSLNEDQGLLYSGSWDKTLKVWRISDSKCLESINAHDDAINSVVSGFDSLVFTGSADGTVKVWRRELQGKGSKHFLVQVLLKQENAVNALAVNMERAVIYCGSSDGLVNYWEREKHLSHGGILRGHKMAVLCLAAAGNLLFSGSADKNICVWRREEVSGAHTCLSVLTGHTGPVKCLAVEAEHVYGAANGDGGGEGRHHDHYQNDDYDLDQDRDHDSYGCGRVSGGGGGDGSGGERWMLYSGSLDKSVKVWRVSGQAPEVRKGRLSFSSRGRNSRKHSRSPNNNSSKGHS